MRYLVLLFGLAGLGATGYLTYHCSQDWYKDFGDVDMELQDRTEEMRMLKSPEGTMSPEMVKHRFEERDKHSKLKNWPSDELVAKYVLGDLGDYNAKMQAFYNIQRTLPFLLSAMFLAVIGLFACIEGHGFSCAALLLVGGAAPAVFLPRVLIATGGLVVAGVFALFVRPRRAKEPGTETL